jgi:membrane associated rhomboid family serine protease
MDDLARRRRRLQSARFLIQAELTIALAAPFIAAFLYVAAPGFIGGLTEPSLLESALPWAAAAGVIVGIAWMVRLSRTDPERGERSWRYRDF